MKRFNIAGAGFAMVPSKTGRYVSHRSVVRLVKKQRDTILVPLETLTPEQVYRLACTHILVGLQAKK